MDDTTYSELVAAAEYNEARMYYNCDVHGQAEPGDGDEIPFDGSVQVRDDDAPDWSEVYALAHPGAMM